MYGLKKDAEGDDDAARAVAPPRTPEPASPTAAGAAQRAVETFAGRYAGLLLAYRFWVVAISVAVIAILALGLRNAQESGNVRVFFGESNPELIALTELEATFTRSNNVIFIVTAKDGDLFTAKALAALAAMTEDAWLTPNVLRVDSLANFQVMRGDGDDIVVEPFYSADEDFTAERLQDIRDKVMAEEEVVNSMVSTDGAVAAISVLIVDPEDAEDVVPAVAGFAREIAQKWRDRWDFLEVRLTGGVMADITFAEAGDRDKVTLIPAMALLLFVALMVGLRSFKTTLAVMLVIAGSVAAGLGAAVWFGATFNAATTSSPIAIMVLAVASAVHLIIGWIQAGSEGRNPKEAVRESVKINFAPILATNITTVIGFLSLNFSDSPPLREMGNMVAVGTLFACLFCLTLLPALISYIPLARPTLISATRKIFDRIGALVTAHPRKLIVFFVLLTAVLGYGAGRIVLDDNYVEYFDDRFEFRRDTDYAERRLTGLNVLQYVLDSGSPGGVFDPVFLGKVDRFAGWLEDQEGVVFVDSITTMIKRLNEVVEGGGENARRIGSTRERNAQNLMLYEISLPVGHELTDIIDIDRARTKITAVVRGASSRDIRRMGAEGEAWLNEFTPEIAAPATGLSVVFAYVSERNIRGMITGTLFALVIVSVILLFVFQSVPIGLLSLVPNLLPGLLAFGVWGFLIGEVNLAATVVTAMTLGIIVDDTIHVTMKYLRARRIRGDTPEAAVRYALATVGFPIVLTSIAIGSGFAIIATSGFQLSAFLGSLTVLIIAFALITDMFLLPPLILMAERFKR